MIPLPTHCEKKATSWQEVNHCACAPIIAATHNNDERPVPVSLRLEEAGPRYTGSSRTLGLDRLLDLLKLELDQLVVGVAVRVILGQDTKCLLLVTL
jgi:hypothetical protein